MRYVALTQVFVGHRVRKGDVVDADIAARNPKFFKPVEDDYVKPEIEEPKPISISEMVGKLPEAALANPVEEEPEEIVVAAPKSKKK